MRQRIINYLSLSKKEWNGMVILVVLILLVLAAPYVYQKLHKDNLINLKDIDKAAALLNTANTKTTAKNTPAPGSTLPVKYISNKLHPGETVEINTADSATLTRIHGIGPAFARRIITFRKKLGGFLNKEQLKDVYGVDVDKYNEIGPEITVAPTRIHLIDINKVDFEQLRQFPYLSYKQANAVIQYRTQHGNYQSLQDMSNIAILDEGILRKIAPYISFK